MTLAGHTGDCARRRRLHASAIAPDLGVGALILANALKLPVPSRSSLLLPRSSERKRAELDVEVSLDELRPSPPTTFLRPSFAQNESPVRSPATSSCSPSVSPFDSGAIAAAAPPRRRGRAAVAARTPPGLPAPARGPLPRAPRPLGLPGPRAAPPRDRPAPPPAERRRRRVPPPCSVCAAALFPHARPALGPARAPHPVRPTAAGPHRSLPRRLDAASAAGRAGTATRRRALPTHRRGPR